MGDEWAKCRLCLPKKCQKWPFLTFFGQAKTTFCPFYYQISSKDDILPIHPSKMTFFAPKTPFSAIFAQKRPFLTFLGQAKTTFCPFYYQISSKDDIFPLHPSKNV